MRESLNIASTSEDEYVLGETSGSKLMDRLRRDADERNQLNQPGGGNQMSNQLGGGNQLSSQLGGNQMSSQLGGNQMSSQVGGGNQMSSQLGGNQMSSQLGGNQMSSQLGGNQMSSQLGGGNQMSSQLGGNQMSSQLGGNQMSSQLGGGNQMSSQLGGNQMSSQLGGNQMSSQLGGGGGFSAMNSPAAPMTSSSLNGWMGGQPSPAMTMPPMNQFGNQFNNQMGNPMLSQSYPGPNNTQHQPTTKVTAPHSPPPSSASFRAGRNVSDGVGAALPVTNEPTKYNNDYQFEDEGMVNIDDDNSIVSNNDDIGSV